eukprot:525773-Pleurochrysis_carterae.AAC.5
MRLQLSVAAATQARLPLRPPALDMPASSPLRSPRYRVHHARSVYSASSAQRIPTSSRAEARETWRGTKEPTFRRKPLRSPIRRSSSTRPTTLSVQSHLPHTRPVKSGSRKRCAITCRHECNVLACMLNLFTHEDAKANGPLNPVRFLQWQGRGECAPWYSDYLECIDKYTAKSLFKKLV